MGASLGSVSAIRMIALRRPGALHVGLALALLVSVGINVRAMQLWFAAEGKAADAMGAKELAIGEVAICRLEAARLQEALERSSPPVSVRPGNQAR